MILLPLILAATITTTPPSTPTPTPQNYEDIQKIRDVVQQKVKEKLQLITQPALTKKGIIGKIVQLDDKTISIDYQNSITIIAYTEDTVFIDQKRNKIVASKLKIGDNLLVLGETQSDNSFLGKRIIISDFSYLQNSPLVVIGKIVDISKTSPIFSLIPLKNKNDQYQIKTDLKTEIITNKETKIKSTDLKPSHTVIVILTTDPKMAKTYYAQKIINLDYSTTTPTPSKI